MIQYIGLKLFKRLGWKIEGTLPEMSKYIIIVGPHTSNWDFMLGILVRTSLGVKVRFLAKHQLFRFPFAWFFKLIGGMPVERSKENNLVDQVVNMYDSHDQLIIGLAPEGTRRTINRWRSGFYHIACKAKIDIVMIGFDFKHKTVRVREPFTPSNNVDTDFPIILNYFRKIDGCHPKPIPFHRPLAK